MTVLVAFAFTFRVGAVYTPHAAHLLKRLAEDGSHAVKEICNDGGGWFFGLMKIGDAVEGTGLAAITYFGQIRVYYQTFEELYLKENCWNLKAWVPGEFIRLAYPCSTH